jgi:hypothetical protein
LPPGGAGVESKKMISDAILTQEVEDLIKTMPPGGTLTHDSQHILEWKGRLSAVFESLGLPISIRAQSALTDAASVRGDQAGRGARNLISLLHEARHMLRMRSPTATSLVVEAGEVYSYFDEVRKIITTATSELFFIDPYMDADFVSRYLTQVQPTVSIRLLSSKSIAALIGAVDVFSKQNAHRIEIRSDSGIHDRYVFLDKRECYQSGASFKDGAKKAPAGIVQIVDAASAMLSTYEGIWNSAKVER